MGHPQFIPFVLLFIQPSKPLLRHKHSFDQQTNPHLASYNVSANGPVPAAMVLPPLTDFEQHRQDIGFRNRSCALRDLDDMLGVIFQGLEDLQLLDNTIVIFTSDK